MAINWKQVRTAAKRQDQQQIRGRTAAGVSAPQAQTQISAQGRIDWDAVRGNAQLLDQQQAQSQQRKNAYEEAYEKYKQAVATAQHDQQSGYRQTQELKWRQSTPYHDQLSGYKRTQQLKEGLRRASPEYQAAVKTTQQDQARGMQRTSQILGQRIAQLEEQQADSHFRDYRYENGKAAAAKGPAELQGEIDELSEKKAALDSDRALLSAQTQIGALDAETRTLLRQYNGGGNGLDAMSAGHKLRQLGYSDEQIGRLAEYEKYLQDFEDYQTRMQGAQQFGRDAPVFSTAVSSLVAPLKALGNVESLRGVLPSWLGGYKNPDMPTNVYSPLYSATHVSSGIRGGVMEDMGQIGQFLYQAGTSALDSAVNMAVSTGLVGAAGLSGEAASGAIAETMNWVMGSQVAADSVYEGIRNGKSNERALVDGIVEGAIEGITEKYSVGDIIENMLSGEQVWKKALRSFASEGAEEIASNWLNRLYDAVARRDKNELYQSYAEYLAQGMTQKQALAAVLRDMALEDVTSFLAGGISGLAMSGAYAATNRAVENYNKQETLIAYSQFANNAMQFGDEATQAAAQVVREKVDAGVIPDASEVEAVINAAVEAENEANGAAGNAANDAAQAASAENSSRAAENEESFRLYNQAADARDAAARKAENARRARTETSTEAINDAEANRAAEAFENLTEEEVKGAADARARQETEAARTEAQFDREVRNDADRALSEAAARYGYDERMTSVLLSGYDGAQDAQQYAEGVNTAYEYGRNGLSLTAARRAAEGIDAGLAQEAWNAGKERFNGTEAGSKAADDGGKRNAGMGPGKQAGAVAEGAGGAKKRSAEAKRVQAGVELENRVRAAGQPYLSGKDIGLSKGSAQRSFREASEGVWTEEMKKAAGTLRDAGFTEVHFTVGSISVENQRAKVTRYVDGAAVGDTVWVNATAKKWTVQQLADHEAFHRQVQDAPGLLDSVRAALVDELGEDGLSELAARYAEAYEGCYDAEELEAYIEEICADTYAGMDRLPEAKTQIIQKAAKSAQEAQQAAEKNGGTRGPPEKYSYAGELARTADSKSLARAEQMEESGASAEDIFRETGWFKGADGQWRFEIDDSKMETDTKWGMLRNPDARRYNMLFEKAYLHDEATAEDLQELQILEGNLKGVRKSPYYLDEVVKHDALFEAYPALRDVVIRFEPNTGTANGMYYRVPNEIVLRTNLKLEPEKMKKTLIHEIQHAIQNQENFASGASTEYWDEMIQGGYSRRRNDGRIERARQEYRGIFDSAPEEFKDKVRKINRARLDGDYDTADTVIDELYDSEYADLWSRLDEAEFEWRSDRGEELNAGDLYLNTAGEIEARDVAARRNLSAEERRNRMPDTGNADTVFAEARWQTAMDYDPEAASIKEQVENSREVLNAMDVVARASVPTNLKTKDSAAAWAAERLKSTGYRVDRQGYGEIYFSKKDMDKGLRYADTAEEKAALAVLPQVLKRGIEIGDHANHKNRAKQTVTFAAPVELNGTRGNMAVVVNRNGSHYYAHRIVMPDGSVFRFSGNAENAAQELSRGVTVSGSLADTTSAASTDSIRSEGQKSQEKFSASEDVSESDTETEGATAFTLDSIPKKAQDYLRRVRGQTAAAIQQTLSMPFAARQEVLKPAIEQMMNEYLQTGRISQETIDQTFDKSYARGVELDTEFYDQYKDVKTRLRDLKVTLSEADRADIADFNDFRRAAFGRLRIANEGGLPVDVAYKEMQQMAPELFPERITHPADQLMQMFEVSKRIEKVARSLDEYYGENAAEFRRWAKNDYEASVESMLGSLRVARRYAEARMRQTQARAVPKTLEEVKGLYAELKALRRTYARAASKNLLTAEDNNVLNRLLRGELAPEDVQGMENAKGILAMYEAKADYDAAAAKIADWRRYQKSQKLATADAALKNADKAKDKAAGIQYSRETMTRNVRDIFPEEDAERIIQTYFEPVRTASANANKLKNQLRGEVKALDLSRKARRGDAVSEAHAVQLLGEAQDNIRYLEQHPRARDRDGKTLDEWRQIVSDLWATSPGLDKAKIEGAVETFRKIYDGLFEQMNDVRIRNGYEPVNYRQGYFPHFQPGTSDGILSLMGKALGIDAEVTALPTTINGLTHTFRPGITYFGHALERIGFDTAYDAVEGFDKYVEGAASVICYTDVIQNLRALAEQVRYRTSDEGLRERVDNIRAREDLTEHQKELEIKEVMEKGRFSLSNFVVELDEYTNLLANKKSKYDRSMEHLGGRRLYNLMKAWENRVAANMVAVNPASWLTNFGVITQAGAQLKTSSILKAMAQTIQNYKTSDGIVEASDFLTNRRGSDPLVQSWQQKTSAVLSTPMEWIDTFSADTIVRARYMENLERGMSEETAMREADDFAANVMADRSKGAMPTIFEARNPLMKMFTQFQLEVNNTFSYLFKDLPREQRKKGIGALAYALFKFLIGGFLYNEVYEYLIGRRPMLDPLGILNDTVGDLTGYELNNLVDAATGGGLIKESEPEGVVGTVQNLAENVGQEAPFVGNLMGGGKLPFSSSLPDVRNILTALDSETATPEEKWAKVGKEMVNPAAYWLLPFGGGQIKKVWQGINALKRQGSYTADGRLQYPIYSDREGDKANAAWRTLLFGKSATPEAQAWVEAGFGALSEKATQTYEAMRAGGVDQRDSYELIKAMSKVKKTDEASRKQLQMQLLLSFDIEDSGKALYYYNMMASDKEQAQMDQLLAEGADMSEYLRFLRDKAGVTGEKDEDGKTVSGSKKAETFALIDGLELTPEQKTALAEDSGASVTGFEPWTENHDRLYKAVSTGKDLKSTLKSLEQDGYEPKELRAAITDLFREEYLAADTAGKARLKGYLRNAFMQTGLTQKEAESKIRKWEEAQEK